MTPAWIAAFGALVALVLAELVVLLGVLRRTAEVMERVEAHLRSTSPRAGHGGLSPGSAVPEFALVAREDGAVAAPHVRGEPVVYLLLSGSCEPCGRLLRALQQAPSAPGGVAVVGIVEADDLPESEWPAPPWLTMLRQRGHAATRALRSDVTPHAFAVRGDGRVAASCVPAGAEDVLRMAAAARDRLPESA